MKNLMMKNLNGMRMGLLIAALLVVALVVPSGPASAGGFLVDPIDSTPVTAPAAPSLPDPLHGFCTSPACAEASIGGVLVTPLNNNPAAGFGFSVSPGPSQTGEFFLKVLVPNNENAGITNFHVTGGLTGTASLVSGPAFTSGDLGTYLGGIFTGASPTNPIGAFLPATKTVDLLATGYFVYEADLGQTTLFGPPSLSTSPLLSITEGLPIGSLILGFLYVTDDTATMIATANSGALFEGHEACGANCLPLETPEPASLLLLGSGLAGLGLWGRKRLRDVQA